MTLEDVLSVTPDDEVVVQTYDTGNTIMRGYGTRIVKMLNETALEAEVAQLEPRSEFLRISIRGDWE